MKRGCTMQRNPGKDSILPCKRSSSELARPGRSKQRRWPPRCISPCVRPCVPSGPPRLFPGHHLCDGRTRSEERRGALRDPATLTPGFGGAGGSTGWGGVYPWGASCKERPGCFWNTGQPTPHINVSVQHICRGNAVRLLRQWEWRSLTTTVLTVSSPVSVPAQRVRVLLLFAWSCRMTCGISVPRPSTEPVPPQWKSLGSPGADASILFLLCLICSNCRATGAPNAPLCAGAVLPQAENNHHT